MLKRVLSVIVVAVLLLPFSALAQEEVDLDMVNRIRQEGFHSSEVMEIVGQLSDVIGPRLTGSPGLKRWSNVPAYIGLQFVGILAQCLLWAFVFILVKPVLAGGFVRTFLTFGIILFAVKIFPRFYDMWMQSTYPGRLLAVEFVNGTVGSFVIAAVFALII